MEKYGDFLQRISYQQAELQIRDGDFQPDGRVYRKVNPDNSFKPFYGDTVVFDLGKKTKKLLAPILDELYANSSKCFCQRLDTSTMHMTLHDLSASNHLEEVASEVFRNEFQLLKVLEESPVEQQKIKMKMNFILNMVDTSLVLGLVPVDEQEWNKLQVLYDIIDKVKVCGYPYLTPHITLAYFNYNGFDENSSGKLKQTVRKLNEKTLEMTLDTKKLYYQKFVSMNEYINIFSLVQ